MSTDAPVERSWLPVPTWWYPVWVSLDRGLGPTDPLLVAVVEFVGIGVVRAEDIAHELSVPRILVESALAHAESVGLLVRDAAGDLEAHQGEFVGPPREDAAWVAWDSAAGRPLLQVWLDGSMPDGPGSPTGWSVEAAPEGADYPRRPSDGKLLGALRVLGQASDVAVYTPVGKGVRRDEVALIRRIRRRARQRPKRGWSWAPVEHRVYGTVVWRPSMAPLPEVETELDPAGWAGLEAQIDAKTRARQARSRRRVREEIAPGVLQAAGFASGEELREAAARTARRELGPAASHRETLELVREAYVQERLAEVLESDWRVLARGWVDVLELLTLRLADTSRPGVLSTGRLTSWRPEEERRLRKTLGGKTWGTVRRTLADDNRRHALQQAARERTDSIGTRILLLGSAVAADRQLERAFVSALEVEPRFFEYLDDANLARRTVVHLRGDAGEVDVGSFRTRVLLLCRAAATFLLPTGEEAPGDQANEDLSKLE